MQKMTAKAFAIVMSCWMTAEAAAQQSPVMGTWQTASGSAQVKIERCADPASGPICGSVVVLGQPTSADGKPVAPEAAVDWRNPDPAKRSQKVLGMTMLWGFKATANPGAFEGGQIYNGSSGKTYTSNITLQPDGKLEVRGYVGVPLFGESQVWTRVK